VSVCCFVLFVATYGCLVSVSKKNPRLLIGLSGSQKRNLECKRVCLLEIVTFCILKHALVLPTPGCISIIINTALQVHLVCMLYPPAPMNHVKYLRAGPAEMPFQNWYTANTNHFCLTDFCQVEIKNTNGLSNKP